MKHHGMFDPNIDPIIPGGISPEYKQSLLDAGFFEGKKTADDSEAIVAFANAKLPGGFEMRKVTVPTGTPYLHNPTTGTIILSECGNQPGVIRIP